MNTLLFTNLVTLLLLVAPPLHADSEPQKRPIFAEKVDAQSFFKGNLHTHTTESDGDADPSTVLQWYKSKGYHFIAITDHDKLTVFKNPKGKPITNNSFITLNGVEITGVASKEPFVPVHVNAICGKNAITGPKPEKPVSNIADFLNSIIGLSKKDGAITIVNHPNFNWALNGDTLLAADEFEMLEIASGHPGVADAGNGEHPSAEELWDTYLSKKHRVYSVAVDDAHHYSQFHESKSNPGRAWIQVWANKLTTESICSALRSGHFYSSRGSKIGALVVTANSIDVAVESWKDGDQVDFIGAGGALLERSVKTPARYTLRGGEGYVRAHVVQPRGTEKREAWTQAYFIRYE